MNEAVILKQVKGNKTIKLVKNSFKAGNKYKCSEIVSELTRIFEILNIHPHKTIREETIRYYFDARSQPCKSYLVIRTTLYIIDLQLII